MMNESDDRGRELMKMMLNHPATVLVIDEEGRMRLTYADELEAARP